VQEGEFEQKQKYQEEIPSKIHSSAPVTSIMVSDWYWVSLVEGFLQTAWEIPMFLKLKVQYFECVCVCVRYLTMLFLHRSLL